MKDITEQKYLKYFSIISVLLIVFLIGYSVFRQMEEFKQQNDPMLDKLREKFTNFFEQKNNWKGMLSQLNKKNIMKSINLYKGNKSYTINKEKVFLCLKDPIGEYYPENMLNYVLIHELAHVISKSIGHTEEFYKIFDELLVEFTDAGLYDPKQPIINNYCPGDE